MPAPAQPTNPPALHGKTGVLAVSRTRGGAVVPVALITDINMDRSSDKVETTSLGDSNKTWLKGLDNVEFTFEGHFDSTDDLLFDAAESPTGCDVEYWPGGAMSSACFKGPAWLDVSIKGGVSSAVTISGKGSANGAWTRMTWALATGATAGTPGTFTPSGSAAPASFAGLTGAAPPIVASPATAWTTGQHVLLGDASKAYWNGSAWTAGQAT